MPETNLHIKYSEQEPNVDEDAEEAIREWREASDDGVHSSLLITSDQYDRGVGLAEEAETPRDRSVALVGEGYDFLETGQEEWRETVPVIEYELLQREMNYTPWKTVIAALHEIGHTLGLDHKDGEIYEVEDGLEASVMAASYTTEYTDVRFSDNIYWRTEFSEKAENSIN